VDSINGNIAVMWVLFPDEIPTLWLI